MSGGPEADAGPPDDAALLAAHASGDPDAFGVLVKRHADRLWAVALRTLGDPEEAADAVQDALVSAYRGAAGFRGDAAVTTWLHRVVVNACLDRVRRRQARPTVPLAERDLPAGGDQHAATEARLDVRAALASLPPEQRAAVVLVDLEDMPVAEAAQVLGVPVGTVKSRCSRGRVGIATFLRDGGRGNPRDGGRGNPRAGGRVPPAQAARGGPGPGTSPGGGR